ncbi:hypothetical protein LUU34_00923300 [Aix galericulata]|nr:hypothetical protein LUU34_00923300 [Aix galericulata]
MAGCRKKDSNSFSLSAMCLPMCEIVCVHPCVCFLWKRTATPVRIFHSHLLLPLVFKGSSDSETKPRQVSVHILEHNKERQRKLFIQACNILDTSVQRFPNDGLVTRRNQSILPLDGVIRQLVHSEKLCPPEDETCSVFLSFWVQKQQKEVHMK